MIKKTLSNIVKITKQRQEETEFCVPSNKFTSSPLACIGIISLFSVIGGSLPVFGSGSMVISSFSSVIGGSVPVPGSGSSVSSVSCISSSLTLENGAFAVASDLDSGPACSS